MSTFQLVTLPLLIVMIIVTGAGIVRRHVTRRIGAFWILLWVGAAVSIADPRILAMLARWLGIGRAADLVFYVAILTGFAAFFVTYLRFRRIDDQLTRIVRHLAIQERLRADDDAPARTNAVDVDANR